MKLCDYGCGQEAIHQFKNGKWCCSSSHKHCLGVRKKIGLGNKNKIIKKETREKLSESLKGRIPWNKGITHSKKTREKLSKSLKGKVGTMKGKKMSRDTKEKMSKAKKGIIPWNKGLKNCHSRETVKKIRLNYLQRISERYNNGYQLTPNYNPEACKLIDQYGKENGYNFQHAENGGEILISGLGYWVDGYDKDKNTVIEIDEQHHFKNGKLSNKDILRQKEIENFLRCKFIRIKI